MSKLAVAEDHDAKLFEAAASCKRDPLRFVQLAYPWREKGGALEKWDGPDTWQRDVLKYIRDNLSRKKPLLVAVAGGNGPGKSALAAWVIDWAMSTAADTRINVTANTGPQLSTKTWPEISKWHHLSLFGEWFDLQHRRMRSVFPDHHDSWRCDAITWEATTPESFQGLHNVGKRMVFVFDESSSIPPSIWEAQEGSLTDVDTEIIWLCLGNPTRATGRFRECFPGGKHSGQWKTFKIDTRKARMANQEQIAAWIKVYGLEHDYVRVRVLSEFPNASSTQFIATDLVEGAAAPDRDPMVTIYDPLVMGVDVAYEGDDKSVIRFRRGRDARTIQPLKFRGMSPMQLAARIAELNEQHHPDAIFIDNGTFGAGVVDRCRQLQLPVFGIDFGSNPDGGEIGQDGAIAYFNKRAEMWGKVREWLPHGMIDDDADLKADLTAVEYGYKLKNGRDSILLERKADMKSRGLQSPDDGDALALTFAHPVAPTDHSPQLGHKPRHQVDYDPFAGMYGRR